MAQPSTPNSPQPGDSEKRFFRSRDTVDFIDPGTVHVVNLGEGRDLNLDGLALQRQLLIRKMHDEDLDSDSEEFHTLVRETTDDLLPITDEERADPSKSARARNRARLEKALSAYDDDAFASICVEYMKHEARVQGKRLDPDMERISQLADTKIDATDKYHTELTDEELSNAYDALEAYGDQFVADMVKRSKSSFEMIPGRKREIKVNREELSDVLSGLATEYYFQLDDSLSDEQKAQEIDEAITLASEQIISKIEMERRAEYDNARPVMKKFYDKWASWGREEGFITKGKLKKAGLIAIPVAGIAALAAPIVTAGAATAGVTALGFMGAKSIGRRLASVKMDRASTITTVAEEQANALRSGITQKRVSEQTRPTDEVDGSEAHKARVELNVDHNAVLEMIDRQSVEIRKRNRNRTLAGTAIALTIGLASSRAAGAVEGLVNYIGDHNPLNNDATGYRLGEDGDSIVNPRDRDGDGVRNGQDYAPNNPDITEAPTDDTTSGNLFEGHQGTRELTPEGRQALAEQLNGYKVKSGDSVWKLSEKFLHEQGNRNPSVYEIDATKDVLLKELRASGNADSRGWLSTGDTIKIK